MHNRYVSVKCDNPECAKYNEIVRQPLNATEEELKQSRFLYKCESCGKETPVSFKAKTSKE